MGQSAAGFGRRYGVGIDRRRRGSAAVYGEEPRGRGEKWPVRGRFADANRRFRSAVGGRRFVRKIAAPLVPRLEGG